MRISDWSSDVCSSDLRTDPAIIGMDAQHALAPNLSDCNVVDFAKRQRINEHARFPESVSPEAHSPTSEPHSRSEEHTSELQSLMRISYAVFCLKKKNTRQTKINKNTTTNTTLKIK